MEHTMMLIQVSLAFQLAAREAFREGIRKVAPKMLEPIMRVDVVTPEEDLGDVFGDLNSRRGQIECFGDKPGGLKVVDVFGSTGRDVPVCQHTPRYDKRQSFIHHAISQI